MKNESGVLKKGLMVLSGWLDLVATFGVYCLGWINRRIVTNVTVVAITGSAGKTTTKDLSAQVLSCFAPCISTSESQNFRISAARLLLKLRRRHRYCVLEVSAGKPGNLDLPLGLSKPIVGVLTLIERDHYKAYKNLDYIAKEKSKVVSRLPDHGYAVLNIDDPRVKAIGEEHSHRLTVVWVGRSPEATVRLLEVSSCWPEPLALTVEYDKQVYKIRTRLHGEHLALSVLSTLGVIVALKLPLQEAIDALGKAEPTEGRMQVVDGNDGVVFLRDDWKAPYWSLHAPLDFLKNARAPRKVAVLGSISDFSTDSSSAYKRFAREARGAADLVVFVGQNAHRAVRAKRDTSDESIQGFTSIKDAATFLKQELRPGDLVLLKGSSKADHLVRLMYDRYQPIQCWRERCGLSIFCGACSRLYDQNSGQSDRSQIGIGASGSESGANGIGLSLKTSNRVEVIVGLGNPGEKYDNTPHNIGYALLDSLVQRTGNHWERFSWGSLCTVEIGGQLPVVLFKPAAKMNHVGPVVRKLLVDRGWTAGGCLVVHDEMDLTIGQARLKRDGGFGGHNGIRSMIEALGTNAFPRIRVGVRSPSSHTNADKRVPSPFDDDEIREVSVGMERAIELINALVVERNTEAQTPLAS